MDSMAPADDVMRERHPIADLEDRLATNARKIALLLTQPRYDEAELAELDAIGRELRQEIRDARPVIVRPDVLTGSRILSGG